MRKWLKTLLLAGVFTVLLCGSALAAGERGICDVSSQSGTTLTPKTAANGTAAMQTIGGKTVYLNAERVAMTYSGAVAGTEYLVFVLEDGTTPTADNIVYIDQKSGTEANSGFDLYPSRLVSGKTYNVYVSSSSNGLMPVGSFGYYADYIPGDADGNGKVDVSDVTAVIAHIVGNKLLQGSQLLAANVTGSDGKVDVSDATRIISYVVGNIKQL